MYKFSGVQSLHDVEQPAPLSQSRILPRRQRESQSLVAVTSCPALFLQITSLFFVWVYLFWTFHKERIIQYVVFVCGFFHGALYFQDSSMLQHVLVLHSFLLPNNNPLYKCTKFCLSIQQLTYILDIFFCFIINMLNSLFSYFTGMKDESTF